MFWQRLGRFDRFLVISATVISVLSAIFIFQDRWIYSLIASSDQVQERIGFVKTAIHDVRRRHSTNMSWSPIDSAAVVYQGDSIFTAAESEAVIQTDRGEQISISPNSLVVINAKTDSIRLDIDYGSVLGQVEKGKKLQIASKGGVTEFQGDDAVVKVDVANDKNLTVNVLEGQVAVSSKEGTRLLGPKQQAQVGALGAIIEPDDVRIELLSPVPDRVLRPEEVKDLVLSWRASVPLTEYQVEVARDSNFKDLIFDHSIDRPLLRPPPLPRNQNLYWRVSATPIPGQRPIRSKPSNFVLAEDRPPTINFPHPRMHITFEEQGGDGGSQVEITANWTPSSASKKWECQLAQSPNFDSNLKLIEANSTSVSLGGLADGHYFVRLRAKDWSEAIWSQPVEFWVHRRPAPNLRPPAVVSATDEFLLVTKAGDFGEEALRAVSKEALVNFVEAVPQLAWNAIAGATSYEIEIASDNAFTKVKQRDLVANTRYDWLGVQIGQYYWRIRSISAGNRRGPFSSPQVITVALAPPTSITEEKNVEPVDSLTLMDSAPPPFLLRWAPTLFTASYEVQFDREATFPKPLAVTTKNAFKKVQAPQSGTYFWRVRSLSETGRALSEWSTPQKYEYARVYVSPEDAKELKAIYPNNETVMMIGAGELKINFKWSTPSKSAKYRIQLSSNVDFSALKFDLAVDKGSHLFQGQLADGWYYWRVRAESDQFTSAWSQTAPFQVKQVVKSFNFVASEKVQEAEIRRLEAQREAQIAEEARVRAAQVAEMAKLEESRLPQLESPEDLVSPDKFVLRLGPIPSRVGPAEHLSVEQLAPFIESKPLLEWHPLAEATEYRVEFSSDKDFAQRIDSAITNRPNLRWAKPRPGRFYWRVQAIAKRYRPSPFSDPQVLEISVDAPVLTTAHGLLAEGNSPGKVTLMWNPVPYAKRYEVDWSARPFFVDKSTLPATASRLDVRLTDSQTFYWRVRAYDEKNQLLGQESPPRPIHVGLQGREPAQAIRTAALYPSENQTLIVPKDQKPRIAFYWEAPRTAGTFVLEVAKDANFSSILLKESTKTHTLTVDLPSGVALVYWRVRLIGEGPTKVITSARKLTLRMEDLRKTASNREVSP